MKKPLISALLSAALTLTACSPTEPAPIAPKTEAASTAPVTTTAAVTTEPAAEPEKETTARTEAPETSLPEKKFPGKKELPVTYQHIENKKGKPCRSVMDGLEYGDFPAKEDIEPAIKFAFDNYFSGTSVYYQDENNIEEEFPCTIDNLSFVSGLYLDFNGDGEKESVIVVENDSVWYAHNLIAVYYNNESDSAVLEKLGSCSAVYISALVYDDCADIIISESSGPAAQNFLVYSFNNGCKKEFEQGKGSIGPADTYICSANWYAGLDGDPPDYYIRTDNGYSLVGIEDIETGVLVEKIPEIREFMEMIEEYYEEDITGVKTIGYLDFFFFMGDRYVHSLIRQGNIMYSDFRDRPLEHLYYGKHWDGEVEYGLCLLQ